LRQIYEETRILEKVAISLTFNQKIPILFSICLKHPGGMEVVKAQPAAAMYAER